MLYEVITGLPQASATIDYTNYFNCYNSITWYWEDAYQRKFINIVNTSLRYYYGCLLAFFASSIGVCVCSLNLIAVSTIG